MQGNGRRDRIGVPVYTRHCAGILTYNISLNPKNKAARSIF